MALHITRSLRIMPSEVPLPEAVPPATPMIMGFFMNNFPEIMKRLFFDE